MKRVTLLILLVVSTQAMARIRVDECQVASIKLKLKAMANQNFENPGTATMKSEMNGRKIIDTTEARYAYYSGQDAVDAVRTNPVYYHFAGFINASVDDIKQGFHAYEHGNLEDDESGVAFVYFRSVKGKPSQVVHHGWAGTLKCD